MALPDGSDRRGWGDRWNTTFYDKSKVPTIVASAKMAARREEPAIDQHNARLKIHNKGWQELAEGTIVHGKMLEELSLTVERLYRNGGKLPKDGERMECEVLHSQIRAQS